MIWRGECENLPPPRLPSFPSLLVSSGRVLLFGPPTIQVRKAPAGFSECRQQGSGSPAWAIELLKFANTRVHSLQAHGISEPHGTSTMAGKTITVDIDHVDVGGARGNSRGQNASPFVDES